MPDQRITGQNAQGAEIVLGVHQEQDLTGSLQVADLVARDLLTSLQTAIAGAITALDASATALTLAANAEQAEADTIMAHVAQLVNAGNQVQTEANALLASLNTQLTNLTTTQAIIQQMAAAMSTSFGSLEDVRSVVQSMLNNMQTLLASSVPLPFPMDPVGAVYYGRTISVAAETETVVAQIVVPAGQTLVLSGFAAMGSTADAIYRMYVDVTPVLFDRTNAAKPASQTHFPRASMPRAGSTTTVKVTATHSISARSQDFEALILGYFTTP